MALLMCREDLLEDVVYEITKGLYEHKDLMLAAHPGAADMGLDKVLDCTVLIIQVQLSIMKKWAFKYRQN